MIIYEGPSELDGKPIVAIIPPSNRNPKTGNMEQLYIIKPDASPMESNRTGKDFSICGNCPLKGKTNKNKKGVASERACYVQLQNGPNAVWKAYKKGNYPKAKNLSKVGAGHYIRLGAYGDPAAIPPKVIKQLLSRANGWTGYTHQLDIVSKEAQDHLLDHVMASVETIEQAEEIWTTRKGRTFRVISGLDQLHPNEVLCPATPEGGSKTNCRFCGLCKGRSVGGKSIAILGHGAGKKHLKVLN